MLLESYWRSSREPNCSGVRGQTNDDNITIHTPEYQDSLSLIIALPVLREICNKKKQPKTQLNTKKKTQPKKPKTKAQITPKQKSNNYTQVEVILFLHKASNSVPSGSW